MTPSLRPKIWRLALGLSCTETEKERKKYQNLLDNCNKYDFLTDDLFLLDVMTVADDHRFFPFGDAVKEIVLCFSRDTTESLYEIHKRVGNDNNDNINSVHHNDNKNNDGNNKNNNEYSYNNENNNNGNGNIYGSNENNNDNNNDNNHDDDDNDNENNFLNICKGNSRSVQPFLGFANYFAPLCYLYDERSTLYSTANRTWDLLWCRLNVISGDYGTILHICKSFENLLTFLNPKLFLHLLSLDVQPLRLAYSWIQMAFVGFFEIDQLLILWDRILGFTDLTLFSLLATSIFISRSEPLLLCTNKEKAISILNEGSRLKVIPLLQMILFKES